jgi:hypothetical protein
LVGHHSSVIITTTRVEPLLIYAEVAEFSHACEDDIVVHATVKDVPYFNAPIFLENKQQIGKVDEILGQIQDYVSFFIFGTTFCYCIALIHDSFY